MELVPELVRLGAHFSISGHSLHPRKALQAGVFRAIPRDRLLIETDAPDQLPPADWVSHPATETRGRPVNSPVNLVRIAEGVSGLLGIPIEELAAQCEANWMGFFGPPFLARPVRGLQRLLDPLELPKQCCHLIEGDHVRPVAQSVIRFRMGLDEQPVSSGRHGTPGQHRAKLPLPTGGISCPPGNCTEWVTSKTVG